ncbi:MAG: pyridoxamine 5'-phosphate oxidase family protein [Cyanobacteria bacterium Co-bin13]|nr:pyridoxamine 5'-phosphate oxidase family protein [Cyanobacteria bacterium Co-bin13]
MPQFQEVLAAYQAFPARRQSLMMSTVMADGMPHASYAPFVMDEDHRLYIYISGLSAHTENLERSGRASVLLIDDESETQQIFARNRLTYDCTAQLLERETLTWDRVVSRFETRFGNIIQMFRQLGDFRIFQLTPYAGRFVVGFGAAYDVDPQQPDQLIQVTGG